MADKLTYLLEKAVEGTLTTRQLAFVADEWVRLNGKRLAADKVAAKLKSVEDACKAALIAQFRRQQITGIGGSTVRVGMDPEPTYEPAVKDWAKYYAYIKEHDAWELLEKRPGRAACRERWEDGELIPGVEKFPVYKLSKQSV